MIPVLLESPYAGRVQRNKAYLQLCIRDCVARGEAPFASHQMLTEALDDNIPEERRQGIEAGLVWGVFAKRTVVYSDYGLSAGMKLGIARAELEGRPIEYRVLPNFEPGVFYTENDDAQDTPWEELLVRALGVKPVPHGACVIVVKRNPDNPARPFILGLEGPKGTGLPGGRIEPGERPVVAAARELEEETGLAVRPGALLKASLLQCPTDNGDIAHGFWVNEEDTFGHLFESEEGTPLWLHAEDLIRDRPGHPPVRFPKYNEWALRTLGVLPAEEKNNG